MFFIIIISFLKFFRNGLCNNNVIVHPIGDWWKSIKHSIAGRLLEVAKYGDYHDRLKAVRQLARIDHLKGFFSFCCFFFFIFLIQIN